MPDNISKDITIKEIKPTDRNVVLKTDEGIRCVIWKTKAESEEFTEAFKSFKAMDLVIGSKVNVWGPIEDKEYKGTKYREMQVRAIRETNGTAQTTPSYHQEEKPDWDAIAIGKTASLFLQAYIASGKSLTEAELQLHNAYELARKVVNYKNGNGVEYISADEAPPITDEDIPF